MKLKHVGIIVVSVLAMSSAAVSAAEGDESVTTTVNGGVIHFKGEVVRDISFQTINDYGALTPRIKATMQ